jgi:type I restriction enzyme S subunit
MPLINKSNFMRIEMPIPYKNGKPDMEKQREIVEILDKFDTLTNDISIGLPAEIEARRQQYEYYREQLLTFKEIEKTDD